MSGICNSNLINFDESCPWSLIDDEFRSYLILPRKKPATCLSNSSRLINYAQS